MTTLHSDIPKAIKNGADDMELDQVIQDYLTDKNIDKTVEEWRLENYEDLRRWAYPSIEDYRDAFKRDDHLGMKLHADMCLDVDERFPSPEDFDKSVEQLRSEQIVRIERDTRLFIYYKNNYDRRYPLEKQNTLKDISDNLKFNLLYGEALTENQQLAIDKVQAVRDWMMSVLSYCFQIQDEINLSDDPKSVTWDFSSFEESDPFTTISEIQTLALS